MTIAASEANSAVRTRSGDCFKPVTRSQSRTIRETTTNSDGSSEVIDYTFGHDEISQRIVADDGQGTVTDETHIFGHDGHGSVRVIYDLAGTAASIAQVFTFAPYGEMIAVHDSYAVSIAVTNRLSSLGYSGEHFDAKARQQYLRARYYNPANGRFNRLDPFAGNIRDPQSLHKYAYVHGDPIGGIDPSGMFLTVSGMLSGLGIGANMRAQHGFAVAQTGMDIASYALSLSVAGFVGGAILISGPSNLKTPDATVISFSATLNFLSFHSAGILPAPLGNAAVGRTVLNRFADCWRRSVGLLRRWLVAWLARIWYQRRDGASLQCQKAE